MKALFNLFRKERKIVEREKTDIIWMNGHKYIISDLQKIKIQDIPESKSVYGWSLEYRYLMGNSVGWSSWLSYKNKIYTTISSTTGAVVDIIPNYRNGFEWRLVALYKMSDSEFRDYKIEKILSDTDLVKSQIPNIKNKYRITAWKVKEDCQIVYNLSKEEYKFKKNTLFIQNEDGQILTIVDQKTPVSYNHRFILFNDLIKKGLVEEVDVSGQKWAHPHLCKELKIKLKK